MRRLRRRTGAAGEAQEEDRKQRQELQRSHVNNFFKKYIPIINKNCFKSFPGDSACIVYDDEDCQVEDWEHPLFFADGESKSFSILKSARNFQ